uniref:Uncharacterized protein n=1 Tax=Anguilla anguilla TaxID=7936 RepID=A0A0E9XTU9_ANGAN
MTGQLIGLIHFLLEINILQNTKNVNMNEKNLTFNERDF